MEDYQNNRQIRVFISSTFSDMQEEREYLFYNVFPKVRKVAESRDVKLVEIDLRWGITYEESSNGKVLEICFKEICNCRPYFIGILGDRYGWCPEINELQKNPNLETDFPWLKDYILQGKSVTEMEMQYGALSKRLQPNQKIYANFYIKEDTAQTSPNQKFLKDFVRSQTSFPKQSYRSPEELGKHVEADLLSLIDRLYPEEECTPFEKKKSIQRASLHAFSFAVKPKNSVIDHLNQFLNSSKRYLVVHGDDGCGKTSTLAFWITQIIKLHKVVYYFAGESKESKMESYKSYVIDSLCELYHMKRSEDDMDFKHFVYEVTLNNPTIFIVDGVDHFDDPYIHPQEFLPNVAAGSKVIISLRTANYKNSDCANLGHECFDTAAREHPEIYSDYMHYLDIVSGRMKDSCGFLDEYIKTTIKIGSLSKKECRNIIAHTLSEYGKKLTRLQLNEIISDAKSKVPFSLRCLISSIINLRSPEDLDEHIEVYRNIKTVYDYYLYLLKQHEEIFGNKTVRDFLLSIIVSRKGVPEHDLRCIINTNQLKFSQVYYGLGAFIRNKSGYIVFANDGIKNVIAQHYSSVSLDIYRQKFIDYYLGMDNNIGEDSDCNSWMWKFDLPYQCKFLSRYDDLYYVVSQPQVLLAQFHGAYSGTAPEYYVGEVVEYWDVLLKHTNYSLDTYFNDSEKYINKDPLSLAYVVMISRCIQAPVDSIRYVHWALDIYSSYGDTYIPVILSLCQSLASIYESENDKEGKRLILTKALSICIKYINRADFSIFLRSIVNDLVELYGDITQNDDLSITYNEPTAEGEKIYEDLYDLLLPISDNEAYVLIFRDVVSALSRVYVRKNMYEFALQRQLEALRISEKYKNKIVNNDYYLFEANCAYDHYECAIIYQKLRNNKEAIVHCEKAIIYYQREKDERIVGNMLNILNKMLEEL
ncbi:protein of unknown function [Prevotella sp. khp1]|uniref:DUF4062 domain-containing protein n=1 Tax=Prevotellaceae TaxID=171552 RepID=UPI00088C437C|nr:MULTISPECIES: DUF4062 domain-containing protein [Prevotellaceae]QVJ81662.1 DUF4062 domain-containing protein [Xylanibacter ruminicola]SDQ55633.1 protein of unknown function [Prevotella sp. khp1]